MAGPPPRSAFRRLVARLARRAATRNPDVPDVDPPEPDLRLPEQRLVDAAARYGRILAGDGRTRRRADAAAAGVRTVPPTDPSETSQPVWVRRLADPNVNGSKAADPSTAEPSPEAGTGGAAVSAPRRPRRGS